MWLDNTRTYTHTLRRFGLIGPDERVRSRAMWQKRKTPQEPKRRRVEKVMPLRSSAPADQPPALSAMFAKEIGKHLLPLSPKPVFPQPSIPSPLAPYISTLLQAYEARAFGRSVLKSGILL